MFNEKESRKVQGKIFNVQGEPFRSGAWWWWFWLFFFNNPKNEEKPRQLMILWSTKNDKRISCNDLDIVLDHSIKEKSGGRELDGAVAAWYFDGEKMHHDYVLERCRINLEEGLRANDTSFTGKKGEYEVKIGKDWHFKAKLRDKNKFTQPIYSTNSYLGDKFNYKIIRMNKLDLGGNFKNEKIHGSAYFQRVFVNAPAVPWYWGIFHFENGGVLTYFNPHFLGMSVKKEISFFDGEELHSFKDMRVRRFEKDKNACFKISGRNEGSQISFDVETYSRSSWTFKKKFLGFGPKTTLVYGEMPAVIRNLELDGREFGLGVGNAEHTKGILT